MADSILIQQQFEAYPPGDFVDTQGLYWSCFSINLAVGYLGGTVPNKVDFLLPWNWNQVEPVVFVKRITSSTKPVSVVRQNQAWFQPLQEGNPLPFWLTNRVTTIESNPSNLRLSGDDSPKTITRKQDWKDFQGTDLSAQMMALAHLPSPYPQSLKLCVTFWVEGVVADDLIVAAVAFNVGQEGFVPLAPPPVMIELTGKPIRLDYKKGTVDYKTDTFVLKVAPQIQNQKLREVRGWSPLKPATGSPVEEPASLTGDPELGAHTSLVELFNIPQRMFIFYAAAKTPLSVADLSREILEFMLQSADLPNDTTGLAGEDAFSLQTSISAIFLMRLKDAEKKIKESPTFVPLAIRSEGLNNGAIQVFTSWSNMMIQRSYREALESKMDYFDYLLDDKIWAKGAALGEIPLEKKAWTSFKTDWKVRVKAVQKVAAARPDWSEIPSGLTFALATREKTYAILLKRKGADKMHCLHLADLHEKGNYVESLVPFRPQKFDQLKGPTIVYRGNPLSSDSVLGGRIVPQPVKTGQLTQVPGVGETEVVPRVSAQMLTRPIYNQRLQDHTVRELPRLRFGQIYQGLSFEVGPAGTLPQALWKVGDPPDRLPDDRELARRFESTEWKLEDIRYLRNVRLSSIQMESPNALPLLPTVYPLCRSLAQLPAVEKKAPPVDAACGTAPICLIRLEGDQGTVTFRFTRPRCSRPVWEACVKIVPSSPEGPLEVTPEQFKKRLKASLDQEARDQKDQDLNLLHPYDPYVTGFHAQMVCQFPWDAAVKSLPLGSHDFIGDDPVSLSVTHLKKGQVWVLKVSPVLASDGEGSVLDRFIKPDNGVFNEWVIETITEELPGPQQLRAHLQLRTSTDDLGQKVQVWVDPSVGSDTEFCYAHRLEVVTQKWRWNGRPLADRAHLVADFLKEISTTELAKAAAASSMAPIVGSGLAAAFAEEGAPEGRDWEVLWFGERPASDHRLDSRSMDFATFSKSESVPMSKLVEFDLVYEVAGALIRLGMLCYSRYEGYVKRWSDSRKEVLAGAQSEIWQYKFTPPMTLRTALPPPRVKLVLPLTQRPGSFSEDNSSEGLAAPMLVVMEEAWFGFGGLTEILEVRVASTKTTNKNQEYKRYQVGTDPILTRETGLNLADLMNQADPTAENLVLPVVGPFGHTFDRDTASPRFHAVSFMILPELHKLTGVKGSPRVMTRLEAGDLCWAFLKLEFRRRLLSINASVDDQVSEASIPIWTQFIPASNSFRLRKNATSPIAQITDEPDDAANSLVAKVSQTGGLRFYLHTGSEPVELSPSDPAFQLWLLLTRLECDSAGELTVENFQGLELLHPGFETKRLTEKEIMLVRVLEIQTTLEFSRKEQIFTQLFPSTDPNQKDPDAEPTARIVRMSPPMQLVPDS